MPRSTSRIGFLPTIICVLLTSCGHSNSDDNVKVTQKTVELPHSTSYFGEGLYESDEVEVDFSNGTTGLVFYAAGAVEDPQKPSLLFVSWFADPTGHVYIDLAKESDSSSIYARHRPLAPAVIAEDGVVSFAFPEIDGYEPPRGIYRVKLGGTMKRAEVKIARRLKEKSSEGTIDLNLFFVKGCGETADEHPAVTEAVDGFYSFFKDVKIEEGDVHAYDISEAEFASIDGIDLALDSPLRRLVSKTEQAKTQRAVNFFFVRDLQTGADDFGTMLGISLGIPAALAMGPNPNAGVVINLSGHKINETDYATAILGRTMAHEASHALGLFHTSEASAANGGKHDLILDTPECAASDDTDKDGLLNIEECADEDAENYMFWLSSSVAKISPGQASVLLHSPVVRGEEED